MGSSQSNGRVECMWLPAQSGKTRKCVEKIKQRNGFFEADLLDMVDFFDPNKGAFHVIICSNNKSLVDQTSTRMTDELYSYSESESESESENDAEDFVVDKVYSWRSGTKTNKTGDALYGYIIDDDVEIVVCCAHKKRLTHLYTLIKRLQKSRQFEKKINVWIDEADASIKLWSRPEWNILEFSKVEKITLISATYDSIIKEYKSIRVLPYAETYMEATYHKLEDSNILKEDYLTTDPVIYLEQVFENHPEICVPGTRLFAPGNATVKTHDEVADFLVEKGFVVCILNGQRKEIIGIPGKGVIDLKKYIDFDTPISPGETFEIGKTIASIYVSNGLQKYPIAITGNLCLGRGITFQSEHFLFNWGVLSYSTNKAEAYQLASRTNGNIKQFKDYAPPTLVMSTRMADQILSHEKLAINMARLVHERLQKDPDDDCSITEEDMKDVKNPGRACMHVPRVFKMTDEEFECIEKKTGEERHKLIKILIKKNDQSLWEKLEEYKLEKAAIPEVTNSYKRHITQTLCEIKENKKSMVDIKDKTINSYNVFIDAKEKQFIVVMYSGATPEKSRSVPKHSLHQNETHSSNCNYIIFGINCSCKHAQLPSVQESIKICKECGEQNNKTNKFCGSCGNKF
jgi:hypothetical protein